MEQPIKQSQVLQAPKSVQAKKRAEICNPVRALTTDGRVTLCSHADRDVGVEDSKHRDFGSIT